MKNYEITIIPLSEEAKAAGCKPFNEKVDAFVLGAIREEENEFATTFTELQGPTSMWGAFAELVRNLMKDFPEQTAVTLGIALAHGKSGNGDGTLH